MKRSMRSLLGQGKTLQVGLTICCLIAFTLFGYDQGVLGGILANENFDAQFNHPSDSETGIIVSSYNLGCFGGCIVNYLVGDKLGRRYTIWLAMVFVLIGASLQTSAFTVAHLIVGRVVTGFGTGIKTSTVPMYQSEMCDRKSRGALVAAEVMFVGVGIVIAYWFDYGMSFVGGAIAWRLPIAVQMIFAIIVVVIVTGLPESPRWLYAKGRETEAQEVLCVFHDKDASDPYIVAECNAIRDALELEAQSEKTSFISLFKRDQVRTGRRVVLAWVIQFMNQAGGINLLIYYAPSILAKNVKLEKPLVLVIAGCMNSMFMIGSILPSFRLDSMGRRKTMMYGCAALSLCMMMVAALLSYSDTPNGKAYASGSVAFLFLYTFIFGMTVNCVPWVYVPEILPLGARTRGTAIGISSNWIWNFTVVMITPVIIQRLQWKAYLIFFVTNALFVFMTYFFFPETSNLRLEDIDSIFARGGNPVKVAREMARELKLHGTIADLEHQRQTYTESEVDKMQIIEERRE